MTLDSFFVFRELAMIGKVVTNTLYMARNESTVVTRVVVTLTGIAFCPFVAVITIQLCLTFLPILNPFPNLARETFTMKKSIQNIASFVGKAVFRADLVEFDYYLKEIILPTIPSSTN